MLDSFYLWCARWLSSPTRSGGCIETTSDSYTFYFILTIHGWFRYGSKEHAAYSTTRVYKV